MKHSQLCAPFQMQRTTADSELECDRRCQSHPFLHKEFSLVKGAGAKAADRKAQTTSLSAAAQGPAAASNSVSSSSGGLQLWRGCDLKCC